MEAERERKSAGKEAIQPESDKQRRRRSDDEGDGDSENDDQLSCEGGDNDNDDGLLYEGDSDSDTDDGFTTKHKVVERAFWDTANSPMAQEEDGERNCLNASRCHKDSHKAKFRGLVIFELYKVIVKLNDKIRSTPCSTAESTMKSRNRHRSIGITIRASHLKADTIDLDPYALLPLSGSEPRPPMCEETGVSMYFSFKINDEDVLVAFKDDDHVNRDLFPGDGVSKYCTFNVSALDESFLDEYGPYIARSVVGNPSTSPILMMAYSSKYRGAWATIDVKMLNKSVKGVSGLIAARPCILYSRIRLLSLKRRDEDKTVMIERSEDGLVGNGGSIKLTRSVVAVPSNSSLIIGAILYDRHQGDGENLSCSGKTFFRAMKMGEETKIISYNGVPTLEVTARWKCSETV
ncbi:potassium channel in Arabidopsis thaliana 3 [Striga asiatica]|uniref:Potassium channel in Arabidopsis thaliana 3 n=1 Tax=Striga asiatica TaxID=4170 RepID=A0A5A7RAB0_STRAF|nr:potassium channel in Arabidopsis thaliana 3 [Striga asiatica]